MVRGARVLRPFALQDIDGKVIASAAARALKPAFQASATCEQKGFIPGRSLVQNVVELDLEARINAASLHSSFSTSLRPARRCRTFSCTWCWRRKVSRNMVRALYSGNRVVWAAAGHDFEIARVASGVLQGSPLSSLFFCAAVIRALVRAAPPKSCAGVTADDVRAAAPEVRLWGPQGCT